MKIAGTDTRFTPPRLAAMGLAFLGVALFLAYQSWDLECGLPPQATLRTVRGTLRSVHNQRGLEVRLAGRPEVFRYPRDAQYRQRLAAALRRAGTNGGDRIELRHAPEATRTASGREYLTFYEVRIDGRVVRSYAQTRRGWRENRMVARALAGVSGGWAVVLFVLAWRGAKRTRRS